MSNGNHETQSHFGKVFPWVVGAILVPITMTMFGHLFNTTYTSAQRLSAIEAEWRDIKANLDRMDTKLDRILENRK